MIDFDQIKFGQPLSASILDDPLPTDAIYSQFQFARDVTEMLNPAP